MPQNPHILTIPGVKNFRDMGGYKGVDRRPIKWGKLYRSGHLSDLAGSEIGAAPVYGIHSVIDFRSEPEKKRHPVRWPEGWAPSYHPTPIGGNAAAWVQELYERLSTSPFPAKELRDQFIQAFETIPIANAEGLKQFFTVLSEAGPDKGVLFHCTAGKDRTGIAGALLMQALGAHEDDIMADFLLTNEAVDIAQTSKEIAERLSVRAGRPIEPEHVTPLVGVEPDFLHAAYGAINREYGSLENYMDKALGLSDEKLAQLHSSFLRD